MAKISHFLSILCAIFSRHGYALGMRFDPQESRIDTPSIAFDAMCFAGVVPLVGNTGVGQADWISISGQTAPDPIRLRYFTYRQTAFPVDGGRILLRTREPLRLMVDEQSLYFDVEGWGIRLPCVQAHDLPRQVVRTFLKLESMAADRALSHAETQQWLQILDLVDYQQFCMDRAAPHYVEGRLIDHEIGQAALVEWADQTMAKIPSRIATALSMLLPGEHFSAFVKFGQDNEPCFIESVNFLGHLEKQFSHSHGQT